jgi:hypothetical protein
MGALSLQSIKRGKASGLRKLICETQSSDSEDDDTTTPVSPTNTDPHRPWLGDFRAYIDASETKILQGMSTIQWWGVSIFLIIIYLLLIFTLL